MLRSIWLNSNKSFFLWFTFLYSIYSLITFMINIFYKLCSGDFLQIKRGLQLIKKMYTIFVNVNFEWKSVCISITFAHFGFKIEKIDIWDHLIIHRKSNEIHFYDWVLTVGFKRIELFRQWKILSIVNRCFFCFKFISFFLTNLLVSFFSSIDLMFPLRLFSMNTNGKIKKNHIWIFLTHFFRTFSFVLYSYIHNLLRQTLLTYNIFMSLYFSIHKL